STSQQLTQILESWTINLHQIPNAQGLRMSIGDPVMHLLVTERRAVANKRPGLEHPEQALQQIVIRLQSFCVGDERGEKRLMTNFCAQLCDSLAGSLAHRYRLRGEKLVVLFLKIEQRNHHT